MTDPIADEAVEAAAKALYLHEHGTYVFANEAWLAGMEGNEKWQERARAALTVAAPHIAAQAKAMPAENLQIVNGWLVERDAHDLDYPAGAAYGPYPDSDAEPLVKLDELPGWPGDTAALRTGIEALRTGIEALRDEWRATGLSSKEHRMSRFTYTECADALDALLREGE